MRKKRKVKGESRCGKHKRGMVRMGVYVEPRMKTLAVLSSKIKDMTVTDLICLGIENVAKGLGILDADGKISPKFEVAFRLEEIEVKKSEVNG
jgi:hypothetical protein